MLNHILGYSIFLAVPLLWRADLKTLMIFCFRFLWNLHLRVSKFCQLLKEIIPTDAVPALCRKLPCKADCRVKMEWPILPILKLFCRLWFLNCIYLKLQSLKTNWKWTIKILLARMSLDRRLIFVVLLTYCHSSESTHFLVSLSTLVLVQLRVEDLNNQMCGILRSLHFAQHP